MSGARAWLALFGLAIGMQAIAATPEQTVYYQELELLRTRALLFEALPMWAFALNVFAAAILFFVWRSQRDVPYFNWLLGACLTGNIVIIKTLYPSVISTLFFDTFLSAWLYCLIRILIPYPDQRLQSFMLRGAALLLVALGLVRFLGVEPAQTLFIASLFCLLSSAALVRLFSPSRADERSKFSLDLGVLLLGLAGFADSLTQLFDWHLQQHPNHIFTIMPFAQMLAVVLALYFLVNRYALTQYELRQLNATLDSRVQHAESELEDRYRLLTKDALDTAALRERSSIYASIHEDLSDKLLQLVYRAPDPATADLARSALAELRDTQKLQAEQHRQLAHVLADAVAEAQSRCDQAQVTLEWQVAPELEALTLNARLQSALTRTLREAISNLLKHSGANLVHISFTQSEDGDLLYRVVDNGRGMDPARPSGRGLVNMRQRLEELGGKVTVASGPDLGTQMQFLLPITKEQE